jgi:RNA polymerase-binding transcription factor DksA
MTDFSQFSESLKARLAALEARLVTLDAETTQRLDTDSEERANELEDLATNEGLETAAVSELGQIRAALDRIKDGTYGHCSKCGGRIAEARLAALPTATTCINCAT